MRILIILLFYTLPFLDAASMEGKFFPGGKADSHYQVDVSADLVEYLKGNTVVPIHVGNLGTTIVHFFSLKDIRSIEHTDGRYVYAYYRNGGGPYEKIIFDLPKPTPGMKPKPEQVRLSRELTKHRMKIVDENNSIRSIEEKISYGLIEELIV